MESPFEDFGDRMKEFEDSYRHYLHPSMPVIVRIDGKSFSSYVQEADKPFSSTISFAFEMAVHDMYRQMHFVAAYTQSDEVSFYLYPRDKRTRKNIQFAGNIQKISSVTASMFTYFFNKNMGKHFSHRPAFFDSRVFTLPEDEVDHYFKWRWLDCTRNAINQYARSIYSHKELNKVSSKEIRRRLEDPNNQDVKRRVDSARVPTWESLPDKFKYGIAIEPESTKEMISFTDKRTGKFETKEVYTTHLTSRPAVECPKFYAPSQCK